jgi:DNA-binding transcriptional MerR regulator
MLSELDIVTIKALNKQDVDMKDIAKYVKKPLKEIKTYLSTLEDEPEPEDIRGEVYNRMLDAGLSTEQALRMIDQALSESDNLSVDELYNEAMTKLNSLDIMSKKTKEGNNGVVIMTEAASLRGDAFRKRGPKKVTRTLRGNLFNARTGKQI